MLYSDKQLADIKDLLVERKVDNINEGFINLDSLLRTGFCGYDSMSVYSMVEEFHACFGEDYFNTGDEHLNH